MEGEEQNWFCLDEEKGKKKRSEKAQIIKISSPPWMANSSCVTQVQPQTRCWLYDVHKHSHDTTPKHEINIRFGCDLVAQCRTQFCR